jgi:hypothetical protein
LLLPRRLCVNAVAEKAADLIRGKPAPEAETQEAVA